MLQSIQNAHNLIFTNLARATDGWLTGLSARLVFLATLFTYYQHSAGTKVGDGVAGFFQIQTGAYAQIVPSVAEAAGYDESAIPALWKLVVFFGTYAEFLLPILIVLGLFTRLSAIGMLMFILVQSFVDMTYHGVSAEYAGKWFDRLPDGIIYDQRLLWAFPLFILLIRGPGILSVDAILGRFASPARQY